MRFKSEQKKNKGENIIVFNEHVKIRKNTLQTMAKDFSFSTNSEMPESQKYI